MGRETSVLGLQAEGRGASLGQAGRGRQDAESLPAGGGGNEWGE